MSSPADNMIADLGERKFIVFAGAGIDKPNGICDWRELLEKLNKLSPLGGVDISKVVRRHYPEIAQMIYVSLEDEGRVQEYYDTINKSLEPTTCKWTSVHQLIEDTCTSIITTNLDTSFEDLFNYMQEKKGKTDRCKYQTVKTLNHERIGGPNNMVYLHGRKGEREIIIKTTDYYRHYRGVDGGEESPLVKLLKKVFCRRETIVFVGFSFEDRYITRTFEKAFQELRTNKAVNVNIEEIKHYAILEYSVPGDENQRKRLLEENRGKSEEEQRMAMILRNSLSLEQRLKEINIEVVRYEYGSHVEIHNWFESIRKIRLSASGS